MHMQVNLSISDDARSFLEEGIDMTKTSDQVLCLGRGPLNDTGPIVWSLVLMPKSQMEDFEKECRSEAIDCRVQFAGYDLLVTEPGCVHELDRKVLAYNDMYLCVQELN